MPAAVVPLWGLLAVLRLTGGDVDTLDLVVGGLYAVAAALFLVQAVLAWRSARAAARPPAARDGDPAVGPGRAP